MIEAYSLQCASLTTKLNLVQMVDRGALTPNEWRSILNLVPIEGGDKPIRRLDTETVNETKMLLDYLEGGGEVAAIEHTRGNHTE